ncbi:MAG: phage tail protein [Deltaproteobacteria bacterium]|nr:phage tail protein [Deltaproteobacteria bacterium]
MDSPISAERQVNRIYGVVIGIVIDNNDPEGLYRVKVKFPWVQESSSTYTDAPDREDFPSNWARIATFMAGPDRGAFWLPEVDDEVLVAFEHGDIRRPFVIGSLWSPVDKAIHDNQSQGGSNDFRTLFSRSGHVIQFQDTEGEGRIIIQTRCEAGTAADGHKSRPGHFIVMDESDGALMIQISDGKQENLLTIDSTNNHVKLESKNGDVTVSAPNGKILLECKTLETKSSSSSKIQAGSSAEIKAGSTMDINSSGGMTIKGATVKIN